MTSESGIVAGIVITVWLLRELVPLLVKVIRNHRSDRPPAPPPRSELPTPNFAQGTASESGRYLAVVEGQAYAQAPRYVTHVELGELGDEMRSLHADLCRRIEMLSRDVGRLEGKLSVPPRPGR